VISLLYSRPTFIFHNWTSILAFSGAILPCHFNELTSIDIDTGAEQTHEEWTCEEALLPLDYTSLATMQMLNNLPCYTVEERPTFWTAICEILKRMEGLQRLRVDLSMYCFGRGRPNVEEELVLRPLVTVGKTLRKRRLVWFVVGVDWKKSEGWQLEYEYDGACPFVLRRIPRLYVTPYMICMGF
jgi:hypothetical protein